MSFTMAFNAVANAGVTSAPLTGARCGCDAGGGSHVVGQAEAGRRGHIGADAVTV